MTQWFYIQQWTRRRWGYVGEEMSFEDAQMLFRSLTDSMTSRPLALIQKDDRGKVIQTEEELEKGWTLILVNDTYGGSANEEI